MANPTRVSTLDAASRVAVDQKGLMSILSCGYHTATLIANSAGATITIGKRKLYNVEKIRKYLNEVNEISEIGG